MTHPLCVTSRCHGRGHKDGCDTADCRGCLPRPAGDGKYLCFLHEKWLAEDAVEAAKLYDELAHRLVGGQSAGDKVSGTPGARLPDPRAVEARTLIRHTLVAICREISEERGFHLPDDDVHAMASYIDRSSGWLAAQSHADETSDELHDIARGKPRSVAYPSGSSRRELHKPCPMDECEGKLMAVMRPGDALLPPEVFCSTNEEHRWGSAQWRELDRLMTKRNVRAA